MSHIFDTPRSAIITTSAARTSRLELPLRSHCRLSHTSGQTNAMASHPSFLAFEKNFPSENSDMPRCCANCATIHLRRFAKILSRSPRLLSAHIDRPVSGIEIDHPEVAKSCASWYPDAVGSHRCRQPSFSRQPCLPSACPGRFRLARRQPQPMSSAERRRAAERTRGP